MPVLGTVGGSWDVVVTSKQLGAEAYLTLGVSPAVSSLKALGSKYLYLKAWPTELFLRVLGQCCTYFWGARNRLYHPRRASVRFPVWARPSTDTPGPAGYSVDEYTRKEAAEGSYTQLYRLKVTASAYPPRPISSGMSYVAWKVWFRILWLSTCLVKNFCVP